ncbi:MAG: GntR family transcriptional regulator [Balneolaceae bacterium]|nr:MAG: GntR family transcriptional regulator [Balneolaceae bacterium]
MEFSGTRPIYMQITDHFCDQILKKRWNPEERIPSVREIAVMMEVNPNTAMRAFHYLQEEEILYNQRGVGYFVAEDAFTKVKELKRKEFIENRLPGFFRDMEILGFTCSELEKLYAKRYGDDDSSSS